jgi:hypothetical protein
LTTSKNNESKQATAHFKPATEVGNRPVYSHRDAPNFFSFVAHESPVSWNAATPGGFLRGAGRRSGAGSDTPVCTPQRWPASPSRWLSGQFAAGRPNPHCRTPCVSGGRICHATAIPGSRSRGTTVLCQQRGRGSQSSRDAIDQDVLKPAGARWLEIL